VPPPPVLRCHIERAAIDLASLNPLSPGAVKLTVAVPQPWPNARFTADQENRLGPAIVVPRIDDLAAGSLNLTGLELSLAGQAPVLMDISAPGFFNVDLLLPELNPQEQQTWTLTGVFKDAAGNTSVPAALPVKVTDVRAPKVYPAGIGLFWTSSPGPSAEVELNLAWPAPAGSLHRVYLADQQGLGLDIAADASRGQIAAAGCTKVLTSGSHIARTAFRLLTEQPIQAGADGRVLLATRLPRSMETVQFLRVVPLGPDGAEPPFEQCGIVPIAVPDSRRPTAPRLEGKVDAETGAAQLRVVADGFDRVALERDEPGLFNAGAAGSEAPQFRIRRAVGKVADPIYARQIGSGQLALEDDKAVPPIFSAELTDDNGGRGLEPFVRYVYWAEVRLPPERRLPASLAPLDPPGGVTVVDPANAKSQPRPISLPSAPRILMHIPPNGPAAPLRDAVHVTRGPADAARNVTLTITIANPPRAHAKADPYRLAVWSQWPEQEIRPINNANGAELEGALPDISNGMISVSINLPESVDPASILTLRLGFVDPINRLSDLTSIDVPSPPPLPAPQLGPVQITAGIPILTIHQLMLLRWQVLSAVDPALAGQYTVTIDIVPTNPLAQPTHLQVNFSDIPTTTSGIQGLIIQHAINKVLRTPGDQAPFDCLFLTGILQAKITVTLTDPLGRTDSQTAAS
jgi:hypothetical protein